MAEKRVERRLAAILAADVDAYSRLMDGDEVGTLRDLTDRRRIMDGLIASYRGRIANTAGDSVLAEFSSAVDAVQCAVETQTALAKANNEAPSDRHINFRIGIHVGDIMVKAGDLFGDGVNIAARLETIAKPGGVCISRAVHDQVRKILPLTFSELGPQSLKNINEPVHAFAVGAETASSKLTLEQNGKPLTLPDKPSIAVLPFQNMSGDVQQEYFADGIVEDIITALSRFKTLFVIARNSSFTYKGRAVDVKLVGRELGVRYVLEGSVRKSANRVRITGQLIDASTGANLWADRFEGTLDDIFDLQDQVAASVVGAVTPKLEKAEIERAKRKPTASLDAYDLYLRGMANAHQWSRDSNDEALSFFYKAIELDPNYASAYAMAAWCFRLRKTSSWMSNPRQETAEAERLARRAIEFGSDDALALCSGAHTLAFLVGEVHESAAIIDRALTLNENLAAAWLCSGWVRIWLEQPDKGIEHLERAMRLSPLDPYMFWMQTATANAHFHAGRYDDASLWAEKALREKSDVQGALRIAVASNALAGRMDEATKALARLRHLSPSLRLSNFRDTIGPYRPRPLRTYEEGMRKAGLPE